MVLMFLVLMFLVLMFLVLMFLLQTNDVALDVRHSKHSGLRLILQWLNQC